MKRTLWSTARSAALSGIVLALACRAEPDPRAQYLGDVAAAEAPVEEELRRFDGAASGSDRAILREAAGRVVSAAGNARDRLEALTVRPSLTAAWREELLFLNHLIPAYQSFAASDAGPAELEKLRSVLQRGRIHQKRGRDALTTAVSP